MQSLNQQQRQLAEEAGTLKEIKSKSIKKKSETRVKESELTLPQRCKQKLEKFIQKAKAYAVSLKTQKPQNLIDVQLLGILREIFFLLEENKQADLGLGDGGVLLQTFSLGAVPAGGSQLQHQYSQANSHRNQPSHQQQLQQNQAAGAGISLGDQTQKIFIETLFHTIFCQNTYIKFKTQQPRVFCKSVKEILQDLERLGSFSEAHNETIDVNNVKKSGNPARPTRLGRHETQKSESNSNLNFTSQYQNNYQTMDQPSFPFSSQAAANQQSSIQYFQSLFGEKGEDRKTLYDMCFDIAIYLLLQMHENEDGEVHYEVSTIILQCFVKHLRMHSSTNANGQQMQCLQVYLALNKLVQNSKHLLSIAKDKDIIGELFNLLPLLFKEETIQMNQSMINLATGGANAQDQNLNQLVLGQGSYLPNSQPSQGANQMAQGLQSGKSSSKIHIQPAQSPMNLNSRNMPEEEKSAKVGSSGNFLDRNTYAKKMSFNRASSEPPSGNKNAVVPVQEVRKISENSFMQDSQDEDIDYEKKDSLSGDTNRPKIPGLGGERQVPPLMMSQVQSMQNQLALQQQYSQSNSVMNNYFNMPINQMNSTSMSQAFKLSFIPQNTLAKSRLTRRQMSMSRKQTLKLNSVTNFNQIMYGGEESTKQRESVMLQQQNSYEMNGGEQTQKSTQQQRKGPLIPKLNINSIVNDNTLSVQRADGVPGMGLYTTSHAQAQFGSQLTLTNTHTNQQQNKSSNRSNQISAYSNHNFENQLVTAQKKLSTNLLLNYQTNQPNASPNPNHLSQFNQARQTNQNNINNESEDQNISIYDEINGSFVDDLGEGQNGYLYDNAEEKLRQLAFQLGESCLTNDLAALISQKRDIELVQSARKTAVQPRMAQQQLQNQQKNRTMSLKLQRSISVSYTAENIFKNRGSIKDLSDVMNQVTNLLNQRLIDLRNHKLQEIKTINQRARIVIMNLAFMLLKRYEVDELRFLKHPIQALNAFIGSENFQNKRHLKQILSLENQSILIDSNIDHEMAQDGKITINSHGRILNPSPNKIQFQHPLLSQGAQGFDSHQLQQITEANQSDTEEMKDDDLNTDGRTVGFGAGGGQSATYVNTQDQNDDSRFSYNIYGNNQQQIRRFQSFFRLESQEKLQALLRKGSVFQQQIYQEEKIVFKIYQKFTFLNEDILRKQVMNELSSFAAKDKGFDQKLLNAYSSVKLHPNSSFTNNMFMVNNLMNHGSSGMAPPISGTPIKSLQHQNLSFDEADDDFYFRKERNQDGTTTLGNSSTLWFHNGIAYEVNTPSSSKSTASASSTASKERLRKKLDVLLYTVDRRLKYLIQLHLDKTSQQFAVDLQQQLSMLNSYLEYQNNRIMLYQVIEVCLESILMIKKCLIDIALKTNIFIMDFSKHMQQPDFFNPGSASYKIRTPQNNPYSAALQRNSFLIENQRSHRNMFSEFLRLIANLLRMAHTPESLKLLNETLIFDEQWQESVKTFSISLFLSDIVSTIPITDILSTQSVSLMIEELRGINLINFEETLFISSVMSASNIDFYQAAKESIFHLILCSLNMMRYFKSVLHFYNQIVGLYFSNYGQYNKSNGKYPASGGPDANDLNRAPADNLKVKEKSGVGASSMTDFNSGQKNSAGEGGNAAQSNAQTQKYWKQIIRKILYQYMYLVTPPNGLLSQYLQNNSINYVNSNSSVNGFGGIFQSFSASRMAGSPSRRMEQQYQNATGLGNGGFVQSNSYRNGNTPLNFKLTKSVLSFTRLMFNLPDKFTKYVFIEELMLFYIRTHYISFIRLYNKNYSKSQKPGNQNLNFQDPSSYPPINIAMSSIGPAFGVSASKDISLQLCKKHLECLFCIAKNRNEDTRRKLYQFKLVHFLTQEIELEFDLQQRRKRFIELSKEEQKKLEQEKKDFEEQKLSKQNTNNLEQATQKSIGHQNQLQGGALMLNLKEAGASDAQANAKIQEQPPSQQNQEDLVQSQPKPKGLPFGMKKLNVASLGLSELKTDDVINMKIGDYAKDKALQEQMNAPAQHQINAVQNQDQSSQQAQAIKKTPFALPKLNVAGLGLSELKTDDVINMKIGDYAKDKALQEQMNAPPLANLNQNQSTTSNEPQQTKKAPFAMPKLNVAGLGLSELKSDDVINMKIGDYAKDKALQEQMNAPSNFQEQSLNQMPQQIKKAPFQMPKLNVAGLGLSELKSDDVINMKIQDYSKNQSLQEQMNAPTSQQIEAIQSKIKEEGLYQKPQQAAKKMPFAMPKLNVAGLGLSELKADDFINMKIQDYSKSQTAQEHVVSTQEEEKKADINQQPPKKLPFALPKLNVAGLGLSELKSDDVINMKIGDYARDKNLQDQMNQNPVQSQLQNLVQQNQQPNLSLQKSPQKQKEGNPPEEEMKTMDPNVAQNNKTIDYGGLGKEQIFQKKAQNFDKTAPFKLFDVDDYDEKGQQAQTNASKIQKQGQRLSDPQINMSPNTSQLNIGSQGALTGTNRMTPSKIPPSTSQLGMIVHIPEEELDEKRKQLLKKNRVNLLPNKRKSVAQSTNRSQSQPPQGDHKNQKQFSEEANSKNGKEIVVDHDDSYGLVGDRNTSPQSPVKNALQKKHTQSETKRNRGEEEKIVNQGEQKLKLDALSVGGGAAQRSLTPSNVGPSSRSSNGSFVGKNKVFVPFLKFPDDIHIDPSEKIKIYQKPDDNRFKLIRAKEGATPEIKRSMGGDSNLNLQGTHNLQGGSGIALASSGGLELNNTIQSQTSSAQKLRGKRGKLLNINSSNNGDSSGTASQAEMQPNAGTKPLNFNFGAKNEDSQRANNRPANIPKPERKERTLTPPPLLKIPIPQTLPNEDAKEESKLPEVKVNDEIQKAEQNQRAIPNLKIPEKPDGQVKLQEPINQAQQPQINETKDANRNQLDTKANGQLTKIELQLNQQAIPKFQLQKDQNFLSEDNSNKASDHKFNSNSIFSGNQMDQSPSQGPGYAIQKEIELTEANFYLKERSARPIYQDEELHVLMISLLTCLLLKPERGILDDLYCSQYPIDNGKQNILYLMHHHLNHPHNQPIVQRVLNKVQEVHPPLAGQRLLKLLCTQLFDIGLYNSGRNWRKIAEGAYAKVYEGETNLSEPQFVAIKQMVLPGTIYARCVLHDIFTEITCLEELRLEPCVTDLYDYGVDSQCYYIVQKRYAFSLREWRLKQAKSLNENLSIYLSIFREFLRSLQIIHSHNVTHYDIKCDNVLIDTDSGPSNSSSNPGGISKLGPQFDEDNSRLKLSIADFGECKMFQDERDELCQRNRGTDYYKSPEMLQLTLNTRKDTDKYDRRKQVGTNRLSDIWSAGCMFYELLTGQILFYNSDYFAFLNRVTRPQEALLTQDKLDLINNNVYLIDFLKYMLVRDSRLRPSIDSVVKRFEHVYALLVSTTAQATSNHRFSLGMQPSNALGGKGQSTLDQLLEQAQLLMTQNTLNLNADSNQDQNISVQQNYSNYLRNHNFGMAASNQQDDNQIEVSYKTNKNASMSKATKSGSLMQILEDVYLSNEKWIKINKRVCIRLGITHVIIEAKYSSQSLRDQFDVLEIQESSEENLIEGFGNMMILPGQKLIPGFNADPNENVPNEMNPFVMMAGQGVMDYLRKVALQRGKVIFIESAQNCGETQLRNGIVQRLIRECLLMCLGRIFSAGTYETYTLIRSQNLFFKISSQRLATLSKWSQITSKIGQYMQTFPRFSCLCGQNLIILKRQFANYQSMQTITCNCSQQYKNVDSSQCPSPGCNEFLKYLKTYFRAIYQAQQQQLESLHWGFLEEEDFMIGPNNLGQQQHNSQFKRMVMANMSQGVDLNSTIVSVCDKRNQAHSNLRGAGMKDPMDNFNLISKSSATVKNYGGGGIYPRWKLFKCKDCHVWTHAINEMENRYALLLNNRVKEQQYGINILAAVTSSQPGKPSSVNIAGLNTKQAAGGNNAANVASGNTVVRVPILKKIKLTLPF